MKLTLSNERIVNTINTLGELSNAKLPVKVAYAITKNINKINVELEAYNKEKAKLINKYGERDEKGKLNVNENGIIDIKELLSIENEIDIHMIQLDDLLNSDYNISPSELMTIDFMIND